MADKIRYEVDPYNRLVTIDKRLKIPKQRRVLDGVFALDKDNSLEYRVRLPAASLEKIPYQVRLKGSWSLTKDHDLRFSLDKSSGGSAGDALTISGDIIDVRGDAILFSVTTKRGEDISSTYVLELSGAWQADANNRLTFKVKKEYGGFDTLIFDAGWEINKNNEIIYRYEKSQLKRKLKVSRTIMLKGQWNIGTKGSLNYELDARSDSALSFKTSLGICGYDYIKYEIGVAVSRREKPVMRSVTLFGAWRLKRGSALFFDVECSDGRTYSISFSAEARLTPRDTISFKLKNEAGTKYVGLNFELNHALLEGDGNLFLRILRSHGESRVLIGAGCKW